MPDSFNFKVNFQAKNYISKEINKINLAFNRLSNKIDNTTFKLNRLSKGIGFHALRNDIRLSSNSFSNLANNVNNKTDFIKKKIDTSFEGIGEKLRKNLLPLTLGITALGTSLALPIRKSKEYEDTMLEIRRAVNLTDVEANNLKTSLMNLKMGSFKDLGAIASNVAKSGVTNIKDIVGISKVLFEASKAVGMDATSAQTAISKILALNELEMTSDSVLKVANMLANLENKMTNVQTTDLADVWKRASKASTALNLKLEEQGAIMATLLSRGISPELAASEFTMFYNRLGDAQKKLGIDFRKKIQTEGIKGFKETIKIFSKLGPAGMQEVLGAEGKKIIETLQTGAALKDLNTGLEAASKAAGTIKRETSEYEKTFSSAWDKLIKEYNNLIAILGTPIKKATRPVIELLTNLFFKIRNLSTEFPDLYKVIKFGFSIFDSFFKIIKIGFSYFSNLIYNIVNMSTQLPNLYSGIQASIFVFDSFFKVIKSGFYFFSTLIDYFSNLISYISNLASQIPLLSSGFDYLKTSMAFVASSLAGVGASLFIFNKAKSAFVSFISFFKIFSIQYIKSAVAFAFNPFTLLILGLTLAVGAIFYLIKNWNSLKITLVNGYNNYIAPVADGFKSIFSTSINFVTKKFYDFIIFFKEKFAWLASGVIGKKIFGFDQKELDNFKKGIDELKQKRLALDKEVTKKVSSKISIKTLKSSSIDKKMNSMSKFLNDSVNSVSKILKQPEIPKIDIKQSEFPKIDIKQPEFPKVDIKQPEFPKVDIKHPQFEIPKNNQTKLDFPKMLNNQNKLVNRLETESTINKIKENNLKIDISLSEPIKAAIKTDFKRSDLKQTIRTIPY